MSPRKVGYVVPCIVINEDPCETLKKQYESVFTTPLKKYEVLNPESFFTPDIRCMDCDNVRVHFCINDNENRIFMNNYDMNDSLI